MTGEFFTINAINVGVFTPETEHGKHSCSRDQID